MKTINFLSIITALLFSVSLCGQNQSAEAFFEVTFDAFTPPTQDLIRSFEGKEPMAFMANDINGTEHYLKNYQGKIVFIYFWNGECSSCLSQVGSLNLLQKEYAEKLQIISIADENKADATALSLANGIEFPVLTNGRLLGEAAYGIELGYPRLFALGKDGKVVHIFPAKALEDKVDIYLPLKELFVRMDSMAN